MDYSMFGKQVFEQGLGLPVAPKAVAEAVKNGHSTVKDIANALGVPPTKVAPVMPLLLGAGVLDRRKGKKPEGKRGKAPYIYSYKGE